MGAETKIEAAASLNIALVAALGEIGGAAKDKVNPAFKSKYADLESVIDAIKPVLARHSLAFRQATQPSEDGVIVETIVVHAEGERSMGTLFVPANKKDAQGHGSALTYARRYSLMTAFGVPAEDDDGNAAAQSAPRADPVPAKITDAQRATIQTTADAAKVPVPAITKRYGVTSLPELPASVFEEVMESLRLSAKPPASAEPALLDDEVKF